MPQTKDVALLHQTRFMEDTLTHWDWDETDTISQTTFSNAFSWMKMYEFRLTFHWMLLLMFDLVCWRIYASLGLGEFTTVK